MAKKHNAYDNSAYLMFLSCHIILNSDKGYVTPKELISLSKASRSTVTKFLKSFSDMNVFYKLSQGKYVLGSTICFASDASLP